MTIYIFLVISFKILATIMKCVFKIGDHKKC